jgi:hypothetical protein
MGSNIGMLFLAASSMLPRFMHPKNMDGLLLPGEPTPPPMPEPGREHFLSRGTWKKAVRSAKSLEPA